MPSTPHSAHARTRMQARFTAAKAAETAAAALAVRSVAAAEAATAADLQLAVRREAQAALS